MTDTLDKNLLDTRPLNKIHAFDPEVIACPHAYYKRLREEAPVHKDPNTGFYMVSNYELVLQVIKQPNIFSSKFAEALMGGSEPSKEIKAIMAEGWEPVDTMLTQDPPEQRRYRKLVDEAFSPRKIKSLRPYIEQIVNALIDEFIQQGECEFVSEFCVQLPMTIIADQMGVPRQDMASFKKWTNDFVVRLSGMATPEQEISAAKGIVEFQKYFAKRLEDSAIKPKKDVISDIATAYVEGERPLDMKEKLNILQQILVAGNETTTSALAEAMYLLLTHPEQLNKLRDNPGLIPNFTDEILRLSSPTQNMWRIASQDTELGGVSIPKGSPIIIRFASANLDESVFNCPAMFDVERPNAHKHLAFGKGIHMCLGAQLAKTEIIVAFEILLQRLKDIELVGQQEPEYAPNLLLRGMKSLEIRFSAAP